MKHDRKRSRVEFEKPVSVIESVASSIHTPEEPQNADLQTLFESSTQLLSLLYSSGVRAKIWGIAAKALQQVSSLHQSKGYTTVANHEIA
jgi:hypothetical protein